MSIKHYRIEHEDDYVLIQFDKSNLELIKRIKNMIDVIVKKISHWIK